VRLQSTEAQIRAAYLRLALVRSRAEAQSRRRDASLTLSLPSCFQKWHPDKHPGDEAAKAFFQQISEAYHGARTPRSRRRVSQG